jgi:hypothetical protein
LIPGPSSSTVHVLRSRNDEGMDPALAALLGTFGGAGIGLLGTQRISATERKEASKRERRRAFASFLGALYPAVSELRSMPPNKLPNILEQAQEKLSNEQADWIRTRKAMVSATPHLFIRIDRLSLATAEVQTLDMPPKVKEAIEDANHYVERLGEERTEELKAEWPSIYVRLHEAKRLLVAESDSSWWQR